MNKRTDRADNGTVKTGKIEDAMSRYSLGRNTMKEIAQKAHAEIRVGRSYLINFTVLDAYFDSITG